MTWVTVLALWLLLDVAVVGGLVALSRRRPKAGAVRPVRLPAPRRVRRGGPLAH